MEDDPALALAQLDSVDAAVLTHADYPYYCLLYTQAQVKNNIVLTDDSLIAVAYEAYAHCGDADLRKRANFYNAQVAYYAKDYRTAMRDILPAYEIARDRNDPYWTAKTAEIIGDIYYQVFNYKQAEIYTRIAAEKYLEAGLIRSHRYALSDLGGTMIVGGHKEYGCKLIDSLFSVITSEETLDSALYEYMKMPMCVAYYRTGRIDKLKNLINEGLKGQYSSDVMMDFDLFISEYLCEQEDIDGSQTLLVEADNLAEGEKERIRVLYGVYRRALKTGEYKKAALLSDTLLNIQSRLAKETAAESVAGVQRDYYSKKADVQEQRWHTLLIILR